MNQLRMSQVRTVKISVSTGRTETIERNRYSYQVSAMVGTNASTDENNKFYNSAVQVISIEGGDYATKVGALCARFVDMGSPVTTQVGNLLSKLLDFRYRTIDMYGQAVFSLKDPGLHDEEGKKINSSDQLTEDQRL